MICTCEKCKRDFFPECEGDVFCPECGGEVVILQGGQELHYLIDLLAKGDVREALAVYINTKPEKKPEAKPIRNGSRPFATGSIIQISQRK